jgi:hypothetical protein
MVWKLIASPKKRLPCQLLRHSLKTIRQIKPKSASILFEDVLNVELRGGIIIVAIQQIVNTCRYIQVFYQIMAEQGEINDGEATGLHTLHRDGLSAGASDCV